MKRQAGGGGEATALQTKRPDYATSAGAVSRLAYGRLRLRPLEKAEKE